MTRRLALALTLTLLPSAAFAATAKTPTYKGRKCPDPKGHTVTDCRVGVHGIPDLSRRAMKAIFGQEVTISEPVTGLQTNVDRGGRAEWPLIDSLAQPMGSLAFDVNTGRYTLTDVNGKGYRAVTVNVRGHGCAADPQQSENFPLVQMIAPKAPNSGTQAFIDKRAFKPSSNEYLAFINQLGGGTGCGPAGQERGSARKLADPRVGAVAHARLSNGKINSVNEYDAKPDFGNTVYFMTNTTNVSVGGVARGMVRVGTKIVKVDQFRGCDPNSDGTLKWRYWSIHTGSRANPRIYGWIPARCRS